MAEFPAPTGMKGHGENAEFPPLSRSPCYLESGGTSNPPLPSRKATNMDPAAYRSRLYAKREVPGHRQWPNSEHPHGLI